MSLAHHLHRLSVERYEQMAEAGLPERGIELTDGSCVEMSPKGTRHADAVSRISACLNDLRRLGYQVFPECQTLHFLVAKFQNGKSRSNRI